jgi:hypothetical protein
MNASIDLVEWPIVKTAGRVTQVGSLGACAPSTTP